MSGTAHIARRWVAGNLRSLVSVAVIIVAWEAVARLRLAPPLFLPSPSAVVSRFVDLVADGSLPADLALSLMRTFAGLALAMTAGVILGIAMVRNRPLHWLFDPLVSLGFPSPKIAFIPVFVLWFGIDSLSKILLVAFACVFPVVIATYDAARGVRRTIIWSAASLGTSRRRLMWRVLLPACQPRIFAALRVAIPVALITTFTSEMVAGGGGMGASLMYAQRFFESPTVYAYIVVMLVMGLVFDKAMLMLRDRIPAWRDEG
ncbi:MAG TPA: ABC transporter permease [Xanthobacteraceae bacterium]|jgi:ABC-type nitrate/sulfonate/bicarbonate transport system permease component